MGEVNIDNMILREVERNKIQIQQHNQGDEVDIEKINLSIEQVLKLTQSFVNLLYPYKSIGLIFNKKDVEYNFTLLNEEQFPFQVLEKTEQKIIEMLYKNFNSLFLMKIPNKIPIIFQQKNIIFGFMFTYLRKDLPLQDKENNILKLREFQNFDEKQFQQIDIQPDHILRNIIVFDEAIQIPVVFYPNQKIQFMFSYLNNEPIITQYFQLADTKVIREEDQKENPLFNETQIIQNIDEVRISLYQQKGVQKQFNNVFKDQRFIFVPVMYQQFQFIDEDLQVNEQDEIEFCNNIKSLIDQQFDLYLQLDIEQDLLSIKKQLRGDQITTLNLMYYIKQRLNPYLIQLQETIIDPSFTYEQMEKFYLQFNENELYSMQFSDNYYGYGVQDFTIQDIFTHYILYQLKIYLQDFQQQKITHLDLYQFLQEIQNLGIYGDILMGTKQYAQHPQFVWLKNIINKTPDEIALIVANMTHDEQQNVLEYYDQNPIKDYIFNSKSLSIVREYINQYFQITTQYNYQQQRNLSLQEQNKIFQEQFNLLIGEPWIFSQELFEKLWEQKQNVQINFVIELMISYQISTQVQSVKQVNNKLKTQTENQILQQINFEVEL